MVHFGVKLVLQAMIVPMQVYLVIVLMVEHGTGLVKEKDLVDRAQQELIKTLE